jgi:cytidylate kinase
MAKQIGKEENKKVIICVSGMTGSGKSSVAKKLASKYNLRYFSGGDALKVMAKEEGFNSEVRGWWETSEGLSFIQQRIENSAFDKKIDDKLLELAENGDVVLDSWTMPWLLKKGFKVWLEASSQARAKRVVVRDHITFEEAMKALTEKDERTRQIYKKLYGFDLGNDLTPFDLVLATDELEVDEVFQAVSLVTDKLIFNTN